MFACFNSVSFWTCWWVLYNNWPIFTYALVKIIFAHTLITQFKHYTEREKTRLDLNLQKLWHTKQPSSKTRVVVISNSYGTEMAWSPWGGLAGKWCIKNEPRDHRHKIPNTCTTDKMLCKEPLIASVSGVASTAFKENSNPATNCAARLSWCNLYTCHQKAKTVKTKQPPAAERTAKTTAHVRLFAIPGMWLGPWSIQVTS